MLVSIDIREEALGKRQALETHRQGECLGRIRKAARGWLGDLAIGKVAGLMLLGEGTHFMLKDMSAGGTLVGNRPAGQAADDRTRVDPAA